MTSKKKTMITVETVVNAPPDQVWVLWTSPAHIIKWNHASEDWHSPRAENDLRPGGKFNFRMEAKNGAAGFDFWGVYDEVRPTELIAYTMGDGRKARVLFSPRGRGTGIAETFEAEGQNPVEMQRRGWQAILDNFKKYAEQGAG